MFFGVFPAFTDRNYRLHFVGQLVSLSGMWLQLMAQSWLVHEMTDSDAWVGFIVALPLGISSLLTPVGGIIADRFPKRNVLYCTQTATAVQCLMLAGMVFFGWKAMWLMIAINCLFGLILAIDSTARNSFIPELVRKKNIGSGVALNGAMIMSAMMLGPGVAGSLLGRIGVGWTFVASGLSTLAVIVTLPMMVLTHKREEPKEHFFKMFWLGIKYTVSEKTIRMCVLLAGLIGMFGFSYRTLMPSISKDVYHSGMDVMGNLMLAAGFGALVGSVIVSANSKRLPFLLFVIGGSLLASFGLVAFSFVEYLPLGMFLLSLAGVGFTLSFSVVRAKSQIEAEQAFRGRVVGFTMMLFFLGMSLGNMLTGFLSREFGCLFSVRFNSAAFLVLAVAVFATNRKKKVVSVPADVTA